MTVTELSVCPDVVSSDRWIKHLEARVAHLEAENAHLKRLDQLHRSVLEEVYQTLCAHEKKDDPCPPSLPA